MTDKQKTAIRELSHRAFGAWSPKINLTFFEIEGKEQTLYATPYAVKTKDFVAVGANVSELRLAMITVVHKTIPEQFHGNALWCASPIVKDCRGKEITALLREKDRQNERESERERDLDDWLHEQWEKSDEGFTLQRGVSGG